MPDWLNRIVRNGEVQAGELVANPLNWRTHPQAQGAALQTVLEDVGWVQEVIVNERTGRMIDGHLRVELALKHGPSTPVPVKYVDLSEDEERAILATIDPIGAMAMADTDTLAQLVNGIEDISGELRSVVDTIAADLGAAPAQPPPPDTPPQPDKAAELQEKWQTDTGQIWRLGDHRIICGDCTDPEVVGRAIAPGEIDMLFTDPPYGVSYGKKNEYLNAIAPGNRIQTPIENDQKTEADLLPFLVSFLCIAKECMRPGSVFYLCSPPGSTESIFRNALIDSGLQIRQEIVWYKNHFVLGRQDYQWIHETLLYGWKGGAAHYFKTGDKAQSTVWEIDRPHNSDLHPTSKPLALMERAIENSSKKGETIADFFLGGGSTLIACENLRRSCVGVELYPGYIAVTLERFAQHTGIEPERVA